MALGFTIQGSEGDILDINSDGYGSTVTTLIENKAGFVGLVSEVDRGSVIGSRLTRALEVTEDFRLRIAADTTFFNEFFTGTVLNTSIWTAPVTTSTVTVGTGVALLNANSSVANNAVSRLQSWRTFPVLSTMGLSCEMIISFPIQPQTNNVCEWGFGIATDITAPTDGAFFRINATGELRAVINYDGIENQSGIINFDTNVGVNNGRHFTVSLSEDAADFWIEKVLVARILRPIDLPSVVSSNQLPVFFRNYNTAITSQAQQMRVSMCSVIINDCVTGKPWGSILAGAGSSSIQTPTGATVAQTAQWANSTYSALFTPTNTTEPGGSTGLGGLFLVTASGLALTTDYIIQSYLNPVGSSTVPGRTLYIRDYKISVMNGGATNPVTPTAWVIALAAGGTSVSLASGESATAKARRIMPVGLQGIAASAPIGSLGTNELSLGFDVPLVINQGERVQTVLRFSAYTTTANQIFIFSITYSGYFE